MSIKSFLTRILAGAENEPTENKLSSWLEKRRSNRIDLGETDKLKVHLLKPGAGTVAETIESEMVNVSLRGGRIIFKNAKDLENVKPGDVFIASLAVDDFPIPVNLEIVRLKGEIEAAVKFKAPFPRELEKLERFLEPRCLGLSLREIDPSYLKDSDIGGFRWFNGVNDTSLFSWNDLASGEIVQQQLVFLEKVVEWKKEGPIRTGIIKSDFDSAEMKYGWAKSDILDFDDNPNREVISQALILIESGNIDKKVKELFLERIKKTE